MSAIAIDWKPSVKKLREFGLISAVIFGALGSFVAWKSGCFESSGKWTIPAILWSLAAWGVVGAFVPSTIKPLFIGLMIVSFPIGWVVSHLLLGIIYYGIFTPTAIIFRLIGRDSLSRKLNRDAPTYWVKIESTREPSSYFSQF